jgi:hypothetical protein
VVGREVGGIVMAADEPGGGTGSSEFSGSKVQEIEPLAVIIAHATLIPEV